MKNLILITALTLGLTQTAHAASSCRSEALDARDKGVHHLVVSFEGLASYFAGFTRRGLIRPLQTKYGATFVSENFSWGSSQKAENCIRDWKVVHGPDLKLSIIGHSFGGGIAVFELLREIKDIDVANVITIDPRSWTTDRNYRRLGTMDLFTQPANVEEFSNFYQTGAMRGYRVIGATNVKVSGKGHTRMPTAPELYKHAACQLFDDCI